MFALCYQQKRKDLRLLKYTMRNIPRLQILLTIPKLYGKENIDIEVLLLFNRQKQKQMNSYWNVIQKVCSAKPAVKKKMLTYMPNMEKEALSGLFGDFGKNVSAAVLRQRCGI